MAEKNKTTKKPRAITSKTIKNMMEQLTGEASTEVERVYNDWVADSQELAPMIDTMTSASLKRLLKSAIVPHFEEDGMSPNEKKASELLSKIMDLRIELFVVSAFLKKTENKEEDKKDDTSQD